VICTLQSDIVQVERENERLIALASLQEGLNQQISELQAEVAMRTTEVESLQRENDFSQDRVLELEG